MKREDNLYLNDIDIGFTMLRKTFIDLGGFNAELKSLEDWDFILRALTNGVGYKLQRFDYAVNNELNRARVSDADNESYLQLAAMYRDQNGEGWYAYMMAHGLSRSNALSFKNMAQYTLVSKKFNPILDYLRQFKNSTQ